MEHVKSFRHIALMGLILCGLIIVGCGAAQKAAEPAAMSQPVAEDTAGAGEMAPSAVRSEAGNDGFAGGTSPAAQGILDSRQVIRTADVTLIVEDTRTAVNQLRSLANTSGGYVADSNLWQVQDNLMRGSVTLRVDAGRFEDVLDRIKQMALEVERESVDSQDVTQEYTDLDSRVRNLEAAEQELLALLSDVRQQTNSADEVLQVYRRLTEIRGEIEQIKGRMQYLDNQTSLATINVTLIPKEEKPIIQAGWQPGETLRSALGALASAGQWLVNAAIWLVVFVLPVGLVVAVPVGLAVMGIRRWRDRPLSGAP